MKSFLSLLLFITALLTACGGEKYVGSLSDFPGPKEGQIKTHYEDGAIYEIGLFKNGVLDGYRKIHYPSGTIQVEETYVAGQFHGPYKKYYDNGQVKISGDYKDGTMEGVWVTYHDNGAIKDEVTMTANLENGPFKEYYPNGKTKAVGVYKNGEFEHGPLQLFDESGTLIKKMECDEGICRTVWKKEE